MSINTYKTRELKILWYCRICWNSGVTSVTRTIQPENSIKPTKEHLLTIVKLRKKCCDKPDIRVVYDEKSIEEFCCGYSN